jgi:hypothetical protein
MIFVESQLFSRRLPEMLDEEGYREKERETRHDRRQLERL